MFNLASGAEVTVNATCGQSEPEIYCKLVEHVYVREPQCGVSFTVFVMTLWRFIVLSRSICWREKFLNARIRRRSSGNARPAAEPRYQAVPGTRLFLNASLALSS